MQRKRVQYETQDERNTIILQYSDLFLIEEQNIFEGNFLVFSDKPLPENVVYVSIPQKELEGLIDRISASEDALLALIMMGGM